jgi:hypothetical protein
MMGAALALVPPPPSAVACGTMHDTETHPIILPVNGEGHTEMKCVVRTRPRL